MNYLNEIKNLIALLPHKLKVRFALDCALDVKDLMGPESIQALDATGKWLKGEATNAEVEAAVNDAANAFPNSPTTADGAAANTAYWAAVCATGPYNAAAAAYQAAFHVTKVMKHNDKEYYEKLKTIISNMSELEKLVYDCD